MIMGRVNSTQSQLSTDGIIEEVTIQPESKDGFWANCLISKDLCHRLSNASFCNRIPCHSENAVEWCVLKSGSLYLSLSYLGTRGITSTHKECVSGLLHCTKKSLLAVGTVLMIRSKLKKTEISGYATSSGRFQLTQTTSLST
ncbi:unnamed protein product [Haemonchus placei]|uniref:Uncharacterized protein n=1 Tax=Haemonchus placei TaxID=6290 RepID=A0A3P8BWS9_HAEPC|nr:unnamed protein product [Haemonchus placei]